METARLPMALVYPRAEGRPVVAGQVAMLRDSLAAIGLMTPISVRKCTRVAGGQDIDAYEIIAGRHRYEAALSLNWKEIDVFLVEGEPDDAELWEIDENFARAELSDAQRADHHVRRERLLKRKGLVSTHGGPRDQAAKSATRSYAKRAAADLGVSERTVRQDLHRGKKIAPDVLAEVAGTDLDKGVVLDEIARAPIDQQREVLDSIRVQRSAVRPAPDPLNDPEAHERQLSALMAAWNRSAAVVRQEFLLRIEGAVFDKTSAGRAA